MNKPLREHYETPTDAGTALQTFRYIDDLEKYIEYLEQNQAQLQQHVVSGKQQIQWQAIDAYLYKFGTNSYKFNQVLKKQARDWFEREFVACATAKGEERKD